MKDIKLFCNISKENNLAPSRIHLYPFIKSFANPFVNITSAFLTAH